MPSLALLYLCRCESPETKLVENVQLSTSMGAQLGLVSLNLRRKEEYYNFTADKINLAVDHRQLVCAPKMVPMNSI